MNVIRDWAAIARHGFVLLAAAALTGCASFYVDSNTQEIDAAQYKRSEPRHPVQLLFEFQTKGVTNANATAWLKSRVIEQVKASGLFTEVGEAPAACAFLTAGSMAFGSTALTISTLVPAAMKLSTWVNCLLRS